MDLLTPTPHASSARKATRCAWARGEARRIEALRAGLVQAAPRGHGEWLEQRLAAAGRCRPAPTWPSACAASARPSRCAAPQGLQVQLAPLPAGGPGLAAIPARRKAWAASWPTTWAWARPRRPWPTCWSRRKRAGSTGPRWWCAHLAALQLAGRGRAHGPPTCAGWRCTARAGPSAMPKVPDARRGAHHLPAGLARPRRLVRPALPLPHPRRSADGQERRQPQRHAPCASCRRRTACA